MQSSSMSAPPTSRICSCWGSAATSAATRSPPPSIGSRGVAAPWSWRRPSRRTLCARCKTSVEAATQLNTSKNLVGSAMAGMAAGGFNAHAANIVAAIFIATGQDPAQVVESALHPILSPADNGEDLHLVHHALHRGGHCWRRHAPRASRRSVSVSTLPVTRPRSYGRSRARFHALRKLRLELLLVQASLELLGVAGASTAEPGANARQLAMVVAAAVMAAELSLLSALSAGHLMRAHMQYNRKAAEPSPSSAEKPTPTTPSAEPPMTALSVKRKRAVSSHHGQREKSSRRMWRCRLPRTRSTHRQLQGNSKLQRSSRRRESIYH